MKALSINGWDLDVLTKRRFNNCLLSVAFATFHHQYTSYGLIQNGCNPSVLCYALIYRIGVLFVKKGIWGTELFHH